MHNVRYLLGKIQEEGITFSDFSPDNIMVDVNERGSAQLLMIDPQFATTTGALAKHLGRRWAENIDRIHFAYKVRTLDMANSTQAMHRIALGVCREFLGHVPSDARIRHWVLAVLPKGLRVAYDTIATSRRLISRRTVSNETSTPAEKDDAASSLAG